MSSQFLYELIPSFYQTHLVDEEGNRLLDVFFNLYSTFVGEALSQARVNYLNINLETAQPFLFKHLLTAEFDESFNDQVKGSNYTSAYNYKLNDQSIIKINSFNGLNVASEIMYSHELQQRYLSIDASTLQLPPQILYFNEAICQTFALEAWGNLLKYPGEVVLEPPFLKDGKLYSSLNFDNASIFYSQYQKQLLGLAYGLWNPSTVEHMLRAIGIYYGFPYAKENCIVVNNDFGDLVVEYQNGTIEKFGEHDFAYILKSLPVGTTLEKYELLCEHSNICSIWDIHNKPYAFTQTLLSSNAEKLLNLLTIDTANKEEYGTLNFDAGLEWDGTELYWDMGNNTGVDLSVPPEATFFPEPPSEPNVEADFVTNFSSWNDSRFTTPSRIYEMFRNVFIINIGQKLAIRLTGYSQADFIKFINRIKPVYTKCIFRFNQDNLA